MHACMHACMYVCTYVCMSAWHNRQFRPESSVIVAAEVRDMGYMWYPPRPHLRHEECVKKGFAAQSDCVCGGGAGQPSWGFLGSAQKAEQTVFAMF